MPDSRSQHCRMASYLHGAGAAPNHPDCCSAGELRPCEGDEEAAVQHLGCPAAAALPSPCRGGLAEMFASVAAETDAPGVDAASSPSTAAAVGTAAHLPCPAARSVPALMDERGAQQMCQVRHDHETSHCCKHCRRYGRHTCCGRMHAPVAPHLAPHQSAGQLLAS